MAKMDSLFPLHLLPHRLLPNYHLYIRPMLASKGALDTVRRQMLGSQKNKQSRRCACKCVQDLLRFLLLRLTLNKGWFAFVDFALAVFGTTMIWNLQMKKKEKAGLSALLGMGFL